jgi:hypothetical protein
MRGACLLSRRSGDVSIFFGRASFHCEGLLDYWFHYELPEEVCWTVWWQASTSHHSSGLTDNACGKLLIIFILSFRVANFLFASSQNTTALHYRYDMQMYCTFVLSVNQHFPWLPASGARNIMTWLEAIVACSKFRGIREWWWWHDDSNQRYMKQGNAFSVL